MRGASDARRLRAHHTVSRILYHRRRLRLRAVRGLGMDGFDTGASTTTTRADRVA